MDEATEWAEDQIQKYVVEAKTTYGNYGSGYGSNYGGYGGYNGNYAYGGAGNKGAGGKVADRFQEKGKEENKGKEETKQLPVTQTTATVDYDDDYEYEAWEQYFGKAYGGYQY